MLNMDEALNASETGSLGRRIMDVALERTGARHGAIMLWDERSQGLAIDFHVVNGLVVTLPDEVVPVETPGGGYNGVAAYAYATNTPYLCDHGPTDPHYAPYYFDSISIAAVPIPYQGRSIGVISVSSKESHAFDQSTLVALSEVAATSAKFLRRAQLFRASEQGSGRPFLIKGLSPEWLTVERRIERVAPTKAPVLITGESGTGKELTAHAIHFNSRRSDQSFVTVNCAAIPETLLESVLFGHKKGAFTGASADKLGEFQRADGGTLFLDELGELPIPLQAKVLRAVEDGEVQPLGSDSAPSTVDVRLIAATNRDLPKMMQAGEFRSDLYFRLSVMTMELPPLRSYKQGNLEVLARVFVKQAASRHEGTARNISPEAMAQLMAHDYPGNVRELKNAMEHAVIMANGDTITADDLPRSIGNPEQSAAPEGKPDAEPTLAELRERWLAPLERAYLRELLDRCGGNVRRAARTAGVNPVTLYRLLERRGMSRRRCGPAQA
jgi:two-component system response regulator HydG